MTTHHMITDIEKEGNCIYCSNKLDEKKWFSKFSESKHYKCIICTCGKSNCVEAGFIGTGHDNWSGLEKKIVNSGNVKIIEKNLRIL